MSDAMPFRRQELAPNLATLGFPSDRVTLGQLRRRQPTIFDQNSKFRIPAGSLEILATVHLENVVARRAFAAECNLADLFPNEDRRELIHLLDAEYRRYGISSGIHQTRQLLRELEAAARKQGREQSGPTI
ncbi:MAG TPA: hypothetical protein VG055_32890 [Planctomycetaceae bacterium]|nr:hypothetical protein [Planctomycetaceae bacterium]